MDHVYINGMELLLILTDTFSGWPELICKPDKRSSVKQMLRAIFSRNEVQKTLVSDNTPECYDKD